MTIVEEFATILTDDKDAVLSDVNEYVRWQVGRQTAVFEPAEVDSADIRTYLLHLKLNGNNRQLLQRKISALQQFYAWAKTCDLVERNLFEKFDLQRPFLTSAEIQTRRQTYSIDPQQREIDRLQALNELAQQLNRVSDIQTVLNTAIHTITAVMQLSTGWIFLLPEIYEQIKETNIQHPHDFILAAACGLPQGLELNERFYLCQPPDCSCQAKLRRGHLQRAVNVVECSRLQDATKAGGESRGLAFHASTPLKSGNQIFGLINIATDEWQLFSSADLQFLSAVGTQVGAALERARLFDLAESQRLRLERELIMAHQVQASLLPDEMPHIAGFSVAAYWQAAREMSGDFYDIIALPNGRLAFIVADVSDKGAPAALYMAMVHSLLRTHCHRFSSPADVLQHVNEHLIEKDLLDMFVTVFCGILDTTSNQFTYASAGHDPPIYRSQSGEIELLMPTGPLLGVLEEITLEEKQMTLASGDLLFAYTDGATDALDQYSQEYGRARLLEVVEVAPTDTAVSCLDFVLDDLSTFIGSHPQFDDITILSLIVDK